MINVYMGADVEDFIFGEGTTYEEACKKEEVETPAAEEPAKEEPAEEAAKEEEPAEEVEEAVEVTAEEMNECGVIECVDDPDVACYRIALENEMNYNAIMNAFMTKEYSVLESTGAEMVYEAVDVSKFFTFIEANVKKFWGKIQGVFKKVMDFIAEYVVYNKAFVKKYKGVDMAAPTKEKEFKGFKFGEFVVDYMDMYNEITKAIVDPTQLHKYSSAEAAEEVVTKFNSGFDAVKDKVRGVACGKDVVAADDFDGALKEKFYGSKEKEVVELKAFSKLIEDLEGAKKVKDTAKEMYKKAEAAVKKMISDVKTAEKQAGKEAKESGKKANSAMRVGKCYTDALNATIGIMSKTFSAQSRAIIVKVQQDRAMAAFYVANQPKAAKEEKKATSESTVVDDLNVVLI